MAAVWTDLVDPSREEILDAVAFALDPEAIETLVAAAGDGREARPHAESHGAYVLLVLSYPRIFAAEDRVEYLELDVVATPSHVVTVRKTGGDGGLAPMDVATARTIEGDAESGVLVHAIVDDLADAFLDLLDGLYEEIDELEGHIEELSETVARRRLVELRHELLHARRTVSATRAAVRSIVDGRVDAGGTTLFPQPVESAFIDTYETLVRVTEELDVARDLLAGVRDYLQSKIMAAQSDVARKLTVIASLVLVPSLIVGFYGQNFDTVFDDRFWSVGVSGGLILATTILQLALFRWRRWI